MPRIYKNKTIETVSLSVWLHVEIGIYSADTEKNAGRREAFRAVLTVFCPQPVTARPVVDDDLTIRNSKETSLYNE
jgi:hypothetical protein